MKRRFFLKASASFVATSFATRGIAQSLPELANQFYLAYQPGFELTTTAADSFDNTLLIVTNREASDRDGGPGGFPPEIFDYPSTRRPFIGIHNEIGTAPADRFLLTNEKPNNPLSSFLQTKSPNRINIIVHGFNTGLEESVELAEEIVEKTNLNGINILYNWYANTVKKPEYSPGLFAPSTTNSMDRLWRMAKSSLSFTQEFLAEYVRSFGERRANADGLAEFILQTKALFPEAKINLIAHSMGASVALHAVHKAGTVKSEYALIDRFVLLSPDVSYNEYYTLIERVRAACGQLHIYTSRQDMALYLSNRIRNSRTDNYESRLGFGSLAESYNELDNVEMLQVKLNSIGINHQFFLKEPFLSDLKTLLSLDVKFLTDIRLRSTLLRESRLRYSLIGDQRKNTFEVSSL